MGLEKYRLKGNPKSRNEAQIVGVGYRITLLTTSLLRFEYSEEGRFEDRMTQTVCNRDFPVPAFKVKDSGDMLHIYTGDLEVHYNKKNFCPNGLMIRVAGGKAGERIWHYGEETEDLFGTARTLDFADGAIPLEHGLLSKDGFAVLDDSASMILTEQGTVVPGDQERTDFYFWGYGHRYLDCLHDFYKLCGSTPLLPRYVFGNWWSRYHAYDEAEYKQLMSRFEQEEIPFSVAVIDMDWHLVGDVDPSYGSGWTGYTWNRKLFPDPPEFLDWLHKHGYKVTLNVHPADGIRAYEEAYPRIAVAMGIDPDSNEPVLFDMTDPKFVETYFEKLHHPLEEQGVDFWWLDWQQGRVTNVPGLDPLWLLNHYHYLDSGWNGRRKLTFSRYAGPGSHRYPIGFSGDTIVTWESLKFQPYFTANASNIGFGWWSHDIGGHMFGVRDDELMARWTEFGVFSPINRLHSTDNPFNGKEPWKYNRIVEETMKEFLKLRHQLVPYLYTMNRRASRDGQPLIQPMYYMEPEREETYQVPNNYYFGSQMMVSPITEKVSEVTQMAKAKTWIPEGVWYDFFTGHEYKGGRLRNLWRTVDAYPVLAKEGAIIPMKQINDYDNSTENPRELEVRIYPGSEGEFVLWEDSGDTAEDLDENWVSTRLAIFTNESSRIFLIAKPKGYLSILPSARSWELKFYNMKSMPEKILADGLEITAQICEDEAIHGLDILLETCPIDKEIRVVFPKHPKMYQPDYPSEVYPILERAQISYDLKADLLRLVKELGSDATKSFTAMELDSSLADALSEVLG